MDLGAQDGRREIRGLEIGSRWGSRMMIQAMGLTRDDQSRVEMVVAALNTWEEGVHEEKRSQARELNDFVAAELGSLTRAGWPQVPSKAVGDNVPWRRPGEEAARPLEGAIYSVSGPVMAVHRTPTFREVGSSAEIGPGSACPESIDVRDPSVY